MGTVKLNLTKKRREALTFFWDHPNETGEGFSGNVLSDCFLLGWLTGEPQYSNYAPLKIWVWSITPKGMAALQNA